MSTPRHAITWFEIPVQDLDRAQRFYEAVLERPLQREAMGPEITLAIFPHDRDKGTGGCLYAGPRGTAPSTAGSVVYLDVTPSLDAGVRRAERAGARIVQPRIDLPEGMGAFVHIVDCEGNRVGLHALA